MIGWHVKGLLIFSCKTVPENRTIAVIGSDREGNVVQR